MVTRVRTLLAVLLTVVAGVAPATAADDDAYLRGYAAAVLEREFRLTAPSLRVEQGVVILSPADLAGADRARVVAALAGIRGVARVDVRDPAPAPAPPRDVTAAPETTQPRVLKQFDVGAMPGGFLFEPLIADPRWPHFAAAHQYYANERDLRNVGAVSFGETFSLYRDRVGGGFWEVGIQAGVFAVFDLEAESKDLVNADYFVAIPLAYRYDRFAALFRLLHQSSHVGDEFLLRNRVANRVNLSYEAVDAKASYELLDMFRLYAGLGYLFDQEPAELKPWSTQWGGEFRSPWPDEFAGWRPIAAVDVQQREENAWHTDLSARAGIQFDGVLASRHFLLLLEYFRGHSPNGQFYRSKVDYFGLGAHFLF
ncbi:MAG: DUF1207 domain-containing protein [Candidatus Rokubacteria bacterium]|nr:DUF1207 domain-containing protein [Candidatus Rokubacteria bacterium]